MSRLHLFTPLPLSLDPAGKILSGPTQPVYPESDPPPSTELSPLLSRITATHKHMMVAEMPQGVPPPPNMVNPKRSNQITKMRESANASFKKGAFAEAIKLYTLAIQMASDRLAWEGAIIMREELCPLYGNRSQAHMGMRSWVEGANDAEVSVRCKPVQNEKAWWRRGRCLVEMGRWEDALVWVEKGLKHEEYKQDGELGKLAKEIRERLEKSASKPVKAKKPKR